MADSDDHEVVAIVLAITLALPPTRWLGRRALISPISTVTVTAGDDLVALD
jgi:hypothetical protein